MHLNLYSFNLYIFISERTDVDLIRISLHLNFILLQRISSIHDILHFYSQTKGDVFDMQLKITTDYAIRTILYLAITSRVTSSSEVSEAMGIPQKYLINTIGIMKRAGLVKTYSGIHGGYALAKDASQISLGDIIETMEGTTKINRCLEDDHFCSRYATDNCPVRNVYMGLQDRVERYLKSITVDQLIQEDKKVKKLGDDF